MVMFLVLFNKKQESICWNLWLDSFRHALLEQKVHVLESQTWLSFLEPSATQQYLMAPKTYASNINCRQ